jgi:hypothetical protein
MRELLLHVGPQKTGTSYIQRVMLVERDALAAAGVAYAPEAEPGSGVHKRFMVRLREEGARAALDALEAAGTERVLVSNEDLARYLLEPSERGGGAGDPGRGRMRGHNLAEAAAGRVAIRVIYVMRRQDALLESHFRQGVKVWYSGPAAGYPEQQTFDHAACLAGLEAAFGRDALRVRAYRGAGGDGGPDILDEMFAAMEVARPEGFGRAVSPQNVALSRRKALMLATISKARAGREGLINSREMSRFLLRVVRASQAVADDGAGAVFPPAVRRSLVQRHSAGNHAVVERYGVEAPGELLELPDPEPDWTPPAPVTGGEVARVFAEAGRAALRGEGPFGPVVTCGRLAVIAARSARRAAEIRRGESWGGEAVDVAVSGAPAA